MAGTTTAYLVAAKMRFIAIMVVPYRWSMAELFGQCLRVNQGLGDDPTIFISPLALALTKTPSPESSEAPVMA